MTIGLSKCPACKEQLSSEAKWCPHCGHPFDSHGSLKGYLKAMNEQKIADERKRKQASFRRFITVLLILIILGVAIYLCSTAGRASPTTMSPGSGSEMIVMPSPTPTAASQATTTIQQYYEDVNSKNYVAAYNMWDRQGESLATFQGGYSHTKYDGLVFGDTALQADGTIEVNVTVDATESTASGGTHLSVYKGYYIVGKRGNVWKLLNGVLNPV